MSTGLDTIGRAARERLSDPQFLARMREQAPAGVVLRSDDELEQTLEAALAGHPAGADLHVFAYGSLMWNPALEAALAGPALVHGWHRRFCLRSLIGRGSPGEPGLMLALDRGGSCNGMLLSIPAAKIRQELTLLWRREMAVGSYDARWVTARTGAGRVPAIAFVAAQRSTRYVRGLSLRDTAALIRTGKGSLGTCRAYFDATLEKLRQLGIEDRLMEGIQAALTAA
jgi:cation transport protein ChaC